MAVVQCQQCQKEFDVVPARVGTAKFCSYRCRGAWRSVNFRGEANPNWRSFGDPREKACQECGAVFSIRKRQPITTFREQKFCSKACADRGGYRAKGDAHPLYRADSRRRSRAGKQGSWARAVLGRDKATCQHCGATGVEMHAHHIKSFAEHPELRWDIDNGITLCHGCHWAVHTALNANGVNSGNIRTGNAEDNPEPSFGRKPVEGVTTRGRAYRRWDGHCEWCGAFISKRWSDVVGKRHLFCSYQCSGKHRAKYGGAFGRPRQ